MTLIEGIGDEVVLVVVAAFVLVMLTIAWLSTQVHERPRMDVVVLDQNRIMQLLNRVRNATTNTLEQTPIGYIVRNSDRQNGNEQADRENQDSQRGQTDNVEGSNEQGTSNEQVSVVYAHLVPDHSVNCPLRQQQTSGSQNPPVSEEVASPANESERPGDPESYREENHGPGAATMDESTAGDVTAAGDLSAAGDPTIAGDPITAQDPTTAEGIRNRRLAFFIGGNTPENSQSQSSGTLSTGTDTEVNTQQTEQETVRASTSVDTGRESEILCQERTNESDSHQETVGSSASNETSEPESERLVDHIRIRLKYLDDRQRLVQARPDNTISQFKRDHFGAELSENTSVRLIYNGQELHSSRTLQSYNVEDSSVIHCLFSQTVPQNTRDNVAQGFAFDMGTLVFPLFGLILGLIWYCRFTYRSYFNAMSTFSLVCITFLYSIALLASLRTRGTGGHDHIE